MRRLIYFQIILLFFPIFFKYPASAQDNVRLGKVGEWNNNYGYFYAVDVKEINGVTYAFCTTSKGMTVFSIRYDNVEYNKRIAEVSLISFVSLGPWCGDIVIEERGRFDKDFYAYITLGYKGLCIRNVTDPAFSYHVGTCDTPGYARQVAISGDYAFVADAESGLQIIDISNKRGPVIVGTCDTSGSAGGVAISGDYAFVTNRGNGLQVIDISDKERPVRVGSCDTLGAGGGVALFGEYAFIAGDSGLQVIDISDKEKPVRVSNCNTSYYPHGVVISGDYAFVTYGYGISYDSGLQVIDISNKERLVRVGSCDTPGSAGGVALFGEYAFVAGDSGLQVIDISDKEGPLRVGSCDTPGEAYRVAISGDYAFVSDGGSGLTVIDISDKKCPVTVSTCTHGFAREVAISEDYAFVAVWKNGLQVIDISDKEGPTIVGTCDTPGDAWGVAISGDYAFVADRKNGLQVIDVSNKEGPIIVGACDTSGDAIGVAISGDYAFVVDGKSGLQVIDITNKEGPIIVGTCNTSGDAIGVAISGSYAFVVDRDSTYGAETIYYSGLQVIDISNKEDPVIVGTCETPVSAKGVAIYGHYAFVADEGIGLQIINISDKKSPVIVGACYTPTRVEGVAISGDYAYVAVWKNGLQVIDISSKKGPVIVGSSEPPVSAKGVVISGDYACVADRGSGLQVIDISDKNGLKDVSICYTPGDSEGVVISGDHAFLADGYSGLQVIDISDKKGPVIVGTCDTPGWAWGIDISGDYAFVADWGSGLQVIDISDKKGPVIVGTCDTPGWSYGIAISGDYAFVADWGSGLQLIDISNKESPVIVGTFFDTFYAVREVTVSENYAFVACFANSLQVIDISNKEGPVIVGTFDTLYAVGEVAVSGNYAFVANGGSGLQIIDISNKEGPVIIGSCDTTGSSNGVAISGDYAFVADVKNGLLKLKINIGPPPEGKGNLILVAGGNISYKSLSSPSLSKQPTTTLMRKRETTLVSPNIKTSYWQITQALANHVFNKFRNSDYEVYDIYYFNLETLQDTDNDGAFNQLVVDDPYPTREELMDIIQQFPEDHLTNNGPLYIYLLGHAAQDCFIIGPGEIITAQDLKEAISEFQESTHRQVVLIIESAASGTFIDDLSALGITIITSTDDGASYIKPDPSYTESIPYNSFTRAFMDALDSNLHPDNIPEGPTETLNTRINEILKDAFIAARGQLALAGTPFGDQAPQMYLPGGPIAFTLTPEDPNHLEYPNLPGSLIIINQKESIALTPAIHYPDCTSIPLDPHNLRFHSSNPQVFDPDDPNQLEIFNNQILISPARNGLATLIAYPDPAYDPNILLTARLSMEVGIPGNPAAGGDKAIIVAGFSENQKINDPVSEATNCITNHAYLSLRKKKLSRDDIFYFNRDHYQDVDRNKNDNDDIDGYPNWKNLNRAFQQIKQTGAEELFIVLIDHGHPGVFNLNPNEDITTDSLAEKICEIDPYVEKTITVLIDACHSGSFIKPLPGSIFESLPQDILNHYGDPNRVIILTSTSAEKDQVAFFGPYGLLSFAYPFFDQFLHTNSILGSFDYAFYFPLYDQDPDLFNRPLAQERDKELVYYIDDPRPVIMDRDLRRENGMLGIDLQVFSLAGIDQVQAYIASCEKVPTVPEEGPITDAHIITLPPDGAAFTGGWYRAEAEDPYPDTKNYQIILIAKDKNGKVVRERTTIGNLDTNKTGAILLVTDPNFIKGYSTSQMEPQNPYTDLSNKIDEQSHRTYRILNQKGIKDDDIYYVKIQSNIFPDELSDNSPNEFKLNEDIPSWLQGKDYSLLLIYLIGEGHTDIDGSTSFLLNEAVALTPSDITDTIDPYTEGTKILFSEMFHARQFLGTLSDKPQWIGIASPEINLNRPLFSSYFFSRLYYFDTIGDAFLSSYEAFRPGCLPTQLLYCKEISKTTPKKRIRERLAYYIGGPPVFGNENSLIEFTKLIYNESEITLILKTYEDAGIAPNSPYVELCTPSGELSRSSLEQEDSNTWSLSLPKDHPYTKAIFYAEQVPQGDNPGVLDWRTRTLVRYSGSEPPDPNLPDIYEWDNEKEYASPIVLGFPQYHTFHTHDDIDWVWFYGHKGDIYQINAEARGEWGYYIRLFLYDPNMLPLFDPNDEQFNITFWNCPNDGYYSLKLESYADPNDDPYSYDLSLEYWQSPSPTADIIGRVVNSEKEGINGIDVYIGDKKVSTGSIENVKDLPLDPNTAITPSMTDGWFFKGNLYAPGAYRITVTAKDDPEKVLANPGTTYLYENTVHWINEIEITQVLAPDEFNPTNEAISGFERVLKNWYRKFGLPCPFRYDDCDGDGLTDLEEFLLGTNPVDPNHPTIRCHLWPGLNLFPFYLSDRSDPYTSAIFCDERLNGCRSIMGYNRQTGQWDIYNSNDGMSGFQFEKGMGYLIYTDTNEVISQEVKPRIKCMNPGINIIPISPLPKPEDNSSYKFLINRKEEGVQSIIRYGNSRKGANKSGCDFETTYMFFGRPAGNEFKLSSDEAYVIYMDGE